MEEKGTKTKTKKTRETKANKTMSLLELMEYYQAADLIETKFNDSVGAYTNNNRIEDINSLPQEVQNFIFESQIVRNKKNLLLKEITKRVLNLKDENIK